MKRERLPNRNSKKKASSKQHASSANQIIVPGFKSGQVVMDRALNLEARVAEGHIVKLEVNGTEIPDTQIGRKLTDPKIGFSSYYFNGINLKAGPNSVKVISVGANGNEQTSEMLSLYGRGPVEEIGHPSQRSIHSRRWKISRRPRHRSGGSMEQSRQRMTS